jgi:hypothetical protein
VLCGETWYYACGSDPNSCANLVVYLFIGYLSRDKKNSVCDRSSRWPCFFKVELCNPLHVKDLKAILYLFLTLVWGVFFSLSREY